MLSKNHFRMRSLWPLSEHWESSFQEIWKRSDVTEEQFVANPANPKLPTTGLLARVAEFISIDTAPTGGLRPTCYLAGRF
jgi:hypothetical protein